jgi:transmembrane sensor
MSKPQRPNRLQSHIRTEATDWLIRFSEGEIDAAAREEFNRWLRVSPEHVRAYLRVSAFWQEADRVPGKEARRDVDALVQLARREGNVIPLELGAGSSARGRTPRRRFPRTLFALASSIVLALIGIASWNVLGRGPSYSTGIGERHTVNLPDGSTVVINARSRIDVDYTSGERIIELRAGQAFFKVAKDPARPFIVRSKGASVRAVGTQFDVYRKERGTIVTVVEGRVAVTSAGESARRRPAAPPETLVAGEQAIVTSQIARQSRLAQPQVAIAWTEGLLMFDGAPLSEVVQEFNRQNVKRLVLTDPALADLRISGTFPASGAERIVRFLQERFGVVITETDDEIRIARL